jgi:hypothetical protein
MQQAAPAADVAGAQACKQTVVAKGSIPAEPQLLPSQPGLLGAVVGHMLGLLAY